MFDRADGRVLAVEWPEQGGLARRVVTRSRARSTGKHASWKAGRMVQWESPNEHHAFFLLDACPDVRWFREQPAAIKFVLNGVTYTHYPDVLVEFTWGRELWEIKPAADANDPFVLARTRLLTAELPALGLRYRMVLAEDLEKEPRLSLAKDLIRHGKRPVTPVIREQVRRVLKQVGSIRWKDARSAPLGPAGRNALCRLALEGSVTCDVDRRITPDTRFFWTTSADLVAPRPIRDARSTAIPRYAVRWEN